MKKIIIFYDNFCPRCTKFSKIILKLDWLKLIEMKELRNKNTPIEFFTIDFELAKKQMATFGSKWHYGFNSLYFIFIRIPLFWLLIPILYFFKISSIGQKIYVEFALKRQIIPIHCSDTICEI